MTITRMICEGILMTTRHVNRLNTITINSENNCYFPLNSTLIILINIALDNWSQSRKV